MINYSRYRRSIEKLYDSTCKVSRYVETETTSGETRLSEEPELVYIDQPCRISQKTLSSNKQTEVENEISYEIKLFIAPELEIRQGDTIIVTNKLGRTQTYTAGEPFPPYPTHQEVSLQREGKA